ncbi:CoA ester lyase [Chelativorans sp. Marseille-P2723]|uniref:HpcH/HpaI aldolase/citrate lyase family protein n=1 Tax=Chelativorans sp. Marseille-P2723 TaxID=2709133 RepID=UPI001571488A|nr:CoA ester lyase [Chelativorans sp. Marseille-P2723]
MHQPFSRLRRSVLYIPAGNEKALRKSASLSCDVVIFDLEDSVAPEQKAKARERLAEFLASPDRPKHETVIRINALSTEWGTEDLLAASALRPEAILLPKVDGPREILDAGAALNEMDAPRSIRLWAMIETAQGMLNAGPVAELGRDPTARLSCLVAGTNDLAKETRVSDRANLKPWLMQMVLAARAGNLTVLDGVFNDFRDLDAFARECKEARAMGFDGKTLIHPSQIRPANAAFAPKAEEIREAETIVKAFAKPENRLAGVISVNGRMVERLHLEQAAALLENARHIREREE